MPGMFYKLEEVMEKLGKSQEEVAALVKEGKLREFRDGDNSFYKVEDVDALAGEPGEDVSLMDDSLELSIDETGEISLAPEELEALSGDSSGDNLGDMDIKLDETGELPVGDVLGETNLADASGKSDEDEILLVPEEEPVEPKAEPVIESGGSIGDLGLDLGGTDALDVPAESEVGGEDIGIGDTRFAGESGSSINVLGDTDSEYTLSDDTSGETKIIEEGGSLDDDLNVGRLDDDVNLDSFGGSGSGLLDLSLQADDTSLGAVLDDIYPESAAGGGGDVSEQIPAGGVGLPVEADEIFGEPEQAAAAEEAEAVAVPVGQAPAAMRMYAEAAPDSSSNIIGATLFVPLIASIYAVIVILSAYGPIKDLNILTSVEDIIWYVVGGAALLVVVLTLLASFSGSGSAAKPKAKKAKTPKTKKVKKAKKAKAKKGKAVEDYQ